MNTLGYDIHLKCIVSLFTLWPGITRHKKVIGCYYVNPGLFISKYNHKKFLLIPILLHFYLYYRPKWNDRDLSQLCL